MFRRCTESLHDVVNIPAIANVKSVTSPFLAELENRVRYELECLSYPDRDWLPVQIHAGQPVLDVLIVGGGQSGISIAFALLRERVTNILVIERAAPGSAGPWTSFARMDTLRTPKQVTGPDLGIASLSVQAWYEARFGKDEWRRLERIPRVHWQDYLTWLQRMTSVPVRHATEVFDIVPLEDELFAVDLGQTGGRPESRLLARRLVLATGSDGNGCWQTPAEIASALPRKVYAHTAEAIDFTKLAGRRVAVLGAGASAFDNAALALEQGAHVRLFARRRHIPRINPYRWMEYAGFFRHFADLDDAVRWKLMKMVFDMNQPPPQDTYNKCMQFPKFKIHLESPLRSIAHHDGCIHLTTPSGTAEFDFLIVGTGVTIDLAARPELAHLERAMARWRDRYQPPPGETHPVLANFPYLGRHFEHIEKERGQAPFLGHVFNYSYGAMLSLGLSAGISGLKYGVPRLLDGITRSLFVERADYFLESLAQYDEPELIADVEPQAP
jgi:cation diffusion facilitator CzcD-associated flavoprotein CzcO